MKKLYSLAILMFLASLSINAQITASGIQNPSYMGNMNVSYSLNPGYVWHDLQTRDIGTDYYGTSTNNTYTPYYFRKDNTWLIKTHWNFESYYGFLYLFKLVEPAVSNETSPPCFGKWESLDENNGNPTGNFFYMTLTGTCSTLNNASPPPVNAILLSPNSISLPQRDNTSINATLNPTTGSMVWSIDDACVKVFNGTSWNCL